MSSYIIDRFEGEYAVCECENGQMKNIARALLPRNVKSGDCLIEQDGVFSVDYGRTEQRRAKIRALQDELFK